METERETPIPTAESSHMPTPAPAGSPAYKQIGPDIYQHTVSGEVVRGSDILLFADAHEESELNSVFEWDDARAACQYRLEQCKKLLGSIMITEDGSEDLQISRGV